MDPTETLKRVLNAMREDPKGLIKAPPPPSTEPSPEQKTADAKLLTAQNQGKSVEVKAQEVAQKAQLQEKEQASELQDKTIDLAKAIVTHKGDQAKQAHEQTMDRAKHGLAVGQAAHKAQLDTHQAVLDTAEAMKPEPEPTTPKP